MTNVYLTNQYINTPNGFVKPQFGAAATAAVSYSYNTKKMVFVLVIIFQAFGFAGCLIFVAEALIRFCRLSDKIQT